MQFISYLHISDISGTHEIVQIEDIDSEALLSLNSLNSILC